MSDEPQAPARDLQVQGLSAPRRSWLGYCGAAAFVISGCALLGDLLLPGVYGSRGTVLAIIATLACVLGAARAWRGSRVAGVLGLCTLALGIALLILGTAAFSRGAVG